MTDVTPFYKRAEKKPPEEVKANIRDLVQKGAPEADVDAYVAAEGYSAQELRAAPALGTAANPVYNPGREAGFVPRLSSSLASSTQERVTDLQSQRGTPTGLPPGQSVFTGNDGEIYVHDANSNQIFPLDRPVLNPADIGDIGGDIAQAGIEAIPMGRGATLVKRLGEAAIKGVVGSAGRQAAHEATSDSSTPLSERLGRVALDVVLAPAAQGVSEIVGGAFDLARNLPARIMSGGAPAKVQRRNQAAMEMAGAKPLPSNITEGAGARLVEGMLERHATTATRMQERKLFNVQASVNNLKRVAVKFGGGQRAAFGVTGDRVVKAYNGAVKQIEDLRRAQADQDFGLVDALNSGAPVFDSRPLVKAIDELIEEETGIFSGVGSDAAVEWLKRVRGTVMNEEGEVVGLTGAQFQRSLQQIGKVAAGKSKPATDLTPAQNTRMGAALMGAMTQSMDDAIAIPNLSAEAAKALKTARANYAHFSKSIESLRESTLSSAVGKARELADGSVEGSEKVVDYLVSKSRTPSELRAIAKVLDRMDPDLGKQLKAAHLTNALKTAGVPSSLAPARTADTLPITSVLNDIRKSPVWEVLDRRERYELSQVMNAFDLVLPRGGKSPTAEQVGILKIFEDVGAVMRQGSLGAAARLANTVYSMNKLADRVLDDNWRRAIMTIQITSPGTKRWMTAATYLAGIEATEEAGQNVAPNQNYQRALP